MSSAAGEDTGCSREKPDNEYASECLTSPLQWWQYTSKSGKRGGLELYKSRYNDRTQRARTDLVRSACYLSKALSSMHMSHVDTLLGLLFDQLCACSQYAS